VSHSAGPGCPTHTMPRPSSLLLLALLALASACGGTGPGPDGDDAQDGGSDGGSDGGGLPMCLQVARRFGVDAPDGDGGRLGCHGSAGAQDFVGRVVSASLTNAGLGLSLEACDADGGCAEPRDVTLHGPLEGTTPPAGALLRVQLQVDIASNPTRDCTARALVTATQAIGGTVSSDPRAEGSLWLAGSYNALDPLPGAPFTAWIASGSDPTCDPGICAACGTCSTWRLVFRADGGVETPPLFMPESATLDTAGQTLRIAALNSHDHGSCNRDGPSWVATATAP